MALPTHFYIGDMMEDMTFFDRLKEFLFEYFTFFLQYVPAQKVKTVIGEEYLMLSAPGEWFPQMVPTVIGFEFPQKDPLVE